MRRLQNIPEWAWLTLAFALRAAFALKVGNSFIQIDEHTFDEAAWSLASARSWGTVPAPPVAPVFFSLFYLAGRQMVLPRLGQALVSTWTAWALGRATREVTGSQTAGRLALAIASVYPFFVYYSAAMMSETLYVACIVMGVWRLVRALRDPALGTAASAGAWLGLASVTRPEGAYIWAVIWAAAALAAAARAWRWKAWVVAVVCWAAPILLWCAHNRAAVGRFALDTHGGVTLLHGTMFFDLNEQDTRFAAEAMGKEPFFQEAEKLPPPERDDALTREAFRFMREHPRQTAHQWGKKFVQFWRFYPRTDKVYIENDASNPGAGASRKALVAVSLLFEPWLILLGLAGLAGLWRAEPRLFPLPLFVLGTMGIHVISVSQMRYRLPAMPLLILGSCWLIDMAMSRSASRDAASSPAGSKR